MQRCQPEHADVLLDTWGWRFTHVAEAEVVRHTLAGSTGAAWPDWPATVRRLRGEPTASDAGGAPPGEEA
jgi:hypothetical protein